MDSKYKKLNTGQDPFVIQEGRFSDLSLEDSHYQFAWAEASFLSGQDEKEMLKRTFDLDKLKYILAIILFFGFILITRIFWLQVVKGQYYYSLAEGNRLKSETIEARRGIIYDSNMKPLVKNEANFILSLMPADLPKDEVDRDNVLRRVANLLENAIDTNSMVVQESPLFLEMKTKLDKINFHSLDIYQPILIQEDLDYTIAIAIKLRGDEFPGFTVGNKNRRRYLPSETNMDIANLSSLSHVLGYTGKISQKELDKNKKKYSPLDYLGKSGLELYYEDDLKGEKGVKNIEVDALGREKKISSESPAQDGYNLQLSLDVDLQSCAETSVKKYNTVGRASLVAIDPRNGQVLSLVSYPAYDNNDFARGVSQEIYQSLLNNPNRPLFSRAVSGEFPPGSTFKPIVAVAALQEKIINDKTAFLSNGGLYINQWSFPDWKAGGHGMTNVYKAIAESVNTFFYYIGGGFGDFVGLGPDKIKEYSLLFGLDSVTGIDLPGETDGFVPDRQWKEDARDEVWYIGDTYHLSIGQGDLLATPLQVANYTAAVANGGTLYSPKIVKKIFVDENNVVKDYSPEIIRQNFISPENMEIVRKAMRQTVTDGSARFLNDLPFEVAGKTGTAQWSSVKANQAWFTGFAPYNNPEIAITVLIEEGGEGSSVAVPVAKEVLRCYFGENK